MADINELQWPSGGLTLGAPAGPLDMPAYTSEDDQSFFSQEDLDRYNEETFWSKDELPIQKLIDILENTSTENYGAFPSYLLKGRPMGDTFVDPLDSSTWDTSARSWEDRYVAPDEAKKTIYKDDLDTQEILDFINRRSAQTGNPEGTKKRLLKEFGLHRGAEFEEDQKFTRIYEQMNLIDYYASLGNPELRLEGEFWPTKKYPQLAIDALKEYQASGKSFKKTLNPEHAGTWGGDDYISLNPNYMYTQHPWDMPKHLSYKKRIKWPYTASVAGHEGIHALTWNPKAINPNTTMRKKDAWVNTMPNPLLYNLQPQKYETKGWSPSAGHGAMHYADALFFPNEQGPERISKRGYENLQSLMNWKPTSTKPQDFTQTKYGKAFNTGGIASLVL